MEIEIKGLKEFGDAIKRNPQVVLRSINDFLVRGVAVYNRILIRNPWRLGDSGGGVPVRVVGRPKGNLRDTHQRQIDRFEARIRPTAPYAEYVHEGTSKMRARPWLDYAQEQGQAEVNILADLMVEKIVTNLAT